MRRDSIQKRSWNEGKGDVENHDYPPRYDDLCRAPEILGPHTISIPKLKPSHLHFLHWVAYHRKFWPTINGCIDEIQKKTCPVNECNLPPFENTDAMQQHLCVCPYLNRGSYHCLYCDNDERISKYHANNCLQPHTLERVRNSFRSAKISAKKIFTHQEPRAQHPQIMDDQVDLPQYPIELPANPAPIAELPPNEVAGFVAEMQAMPMDNSLPWYVPQHEPQRQMADLIENKHQTIARNTSIQNDAETTHNGRTGPSLLVENEDYYQNHAGTGAMHTEGYINNCATSASASQVDNYSPGWNNTTVQQSTPPVSLLDEHQFTSWGTPQHPFYYEEAFDQNTSIGSYLSQGTRGYSLVSSIDSTPSSRNNSMSDWDDTHHSGPCQNEVAIYGDVDAMYEEPGQMLDFEHLKVRTPFRSSLADIEGLVFENVASSKHFVSQVVTAPQYLPTQNQYKPSLTPSMPPSPDNNSSASSDVSTPESSAPQTPPAIRRSGPSTRVSKSRSVPRANTNYTCKCGYAPKGPSNLSRHRNTCPAQAPDFNKRKVHICNFENCGRRFTRGDNLRVHQKQKGHLATIELPAMMIESQMSTPTEWEGETVDRSFEMNGDMEGKM